MANSLDAMSPTVWSRIMGIKRYKANVYKSLADFSEEAVLEMGRIVDRPYRSDLRTETYTKGTAATVQDLTATSDQLTVNVSRTILMYVDNVDKIQNKYDAAVQWGEEAAIRIANDEDAWFLYEVINSNNTVDDASVGGTSGDGIILTVSNIIDVYGKINEALDVDNVPQDERFIVISPQWKNVLWKYIEGKESALGDKTGQYGNIGEYAGLQHYVSNNLTGEATWVPANNPSNTNTITIQGITFTFVSSIGSTAGNVLIGGDTATTLDNLVALINAPGTTTANGVAFTGNNLRDIQDKWVAVDGTTSITVRVKGSSFLTVSGSDATDVWTTTRKIQNVFAGRNGCVAMVVQKDPSTDMDKTISNGKWGMNIMVVDLFGLKTFNQGANEMVRVKVASSTF